MSGSQAQSPRSLRTVLLGILAEFDRVCAEHGLRYIVTQGTLLGAVRDGGFAPGDDDLDVAMLRADYDRLVALAQDGAFTEPYFLQTPENDPGCFYGGYAKLRDSSSSAIDRNYFPYLFSNQGIWMDILPLDDCPLDDRDVEHRQRVVRFWQRILYAKTYRLDPGKFWDADPAHVSAYFILEKRMSRETVCKRLRKSCMASKPTGQLTVFARHFQGAPNLVRYTVRDVVSARRVPFEDTTVPVQPDAEVWLARQYGPDWDTVPAVGDSESGHNVFIDPNVSYIEYLTQKRELPSKDAGSES